MYIFNIFKSELSVDLPCVSVVIVRLYIIKNGLATMDDAGNSV